MPFTSETGRENGLAHGAKGGLAGSRENKAMAGRIGGTISRKAGLSEKQSAIKAVTSARNGLNGGRPITLSCTCGALDGQKHKSRCPVARRKPKGAQNAV